MELTMQKMLEFQHCVDVWQSFASDCTDWLLPRT